MLIRTLLTGDSARPTGLVRPNMASPQAHGLRWWVPLSEPRVAAPPARFFYGTNFSNPADSRTSTPNQVPVPAPLGVAMSQASDGRWNFAGPGLSSAAPTMLPGSSQRATFTIWFTVDTLSNFLGLFCDAGAQIQILIGNATFGTPLTYTWNFESAEFDANNGLTLTLGRLYFGALAVMPTAATVYVWDEVMGWRSWTRTATHNARSPGGFQIGQGSSGYWRGKLADFRVYDWTLALEQLEALVDPATRWELYWRPSRRFFDLTAGGVTYPRLERGIRGLHRGVA